MTEFMKIFVDSSVLVEHFKGNSRAVRLVREILTRPNVKGFVNDIVYSEVAYVFIRTKAGKSHLSLKKEKDLVKHLGKEFSSSVYPILEELEFLEVNGEIVSMANDFIVEYGLLPNDALILATCKFYGIERLATLDVEDFETPCKEEGITLVSSSENL